MRILLALTLMLFAGTGKLFPQVPLWQWAIQIASPGNEQAWDLFTESNGDLLLAGSYDGNLGVIFGVPFITPNQKDGFVANYSSAGNFQWAIRIGGNNNEEVKGITTDTAGNIYVTGYFEGTADFDPGLFSTFNLTSAGGRDGFLARYSSSGAFDWAIRFGGTNDDEGAKVTANSSGIFVTGSCQPSAVFHSTNSSTLSAGSTPAGQNFCIARYSTTGVVQWVAGGGSSGADAGKDIVCDNSNVYVTGDYFSDFTGYNASGTSAGTLTAQTNNKFSVFVIAYNLNGTVSWLTNATSADDDFAGGIAQDSLRLYIAGSFRNGTFSLPYPTPTHTIANSGGHDIYLAALNKSNGAFQWVSQQTGSGANDEAAVVAVKQSNGPIVIGGTYKGVLSYSAVGGPSTTSAGNEDIFISAFDDNGSFLWNTTAGGGNIDSPYGLATSATGAVYACGEHANGVAFGGITLLNAAGKNIFVAKTGCEGVANNTITGTQTICAGISPTFTGSLPTAPGGGTVAFVWQQSGNAINWSPAAGTNTTQNYIAGPLVTSAYFRRVTFATGSCTFATNIVTVSVDQPPTLSAAGSSFAVCSSTALLNGNVPAVGSGSWSVVSGGGVPASAGAPATTVSNLSAGSNVLQWNISNGVCPASSSTLLIVRDSPPGPAFAGPSQTVCSASATLAASAPSTGAGSWSLLSGTAVITASGNVSTGVNGLSAGISVFEWSVANGVCPAASSTVSVQRDQLPSAAQASGDQTVCSTSSSVNSVPPTIGTGQWSALTGSAVLSAPMSSTSGITNLQTGANLFLWTVSNGVCPASYDTLIIRRDAFPGPAIAGASQTVCSQSATLAAISPTAGTGMWSTISGSAAIISATNPVTGVNSLSAGANGFMWTVSNGICPVVTSTVEVQRDTPPGPVQVSAHQTVCITSTSIAALTPTSGTGQWSVLTGGGTVAAPQSATTTVSNLQTGTNKLLWTVSNGACPPATDTLFILRDASPGPALAGAHQTLCASFATISATTPTTGTGTWTVQSGNGVVSNPSNPVSQVSSLAAGNNVFVWMVTNGVCPAVSATVTVQRDVPPGPVAAMASQTVCSATGTISAITPTTGVGSWTVAGGPAAITASTAAQTQVTGLQTGTNVFIWTVISGACPPGSDTVTLTRDAFPGPASAGPDQVICTSSATLSAAVPTAGTGSWSLAAGQATISNATSFSTAVTCFTGTNVFVWTVTNGLCTAVSDTASVTVDALPTTALATPGSTVCASSTTISANTPVVGQGLWTVASGNASVTSAGNATTAVTSLDFGVNTFIWTIVNGVCPPSTATVNIQRDQPPSLPDAGKDQLICSTSATVSGSPPVTGSGSWQLAGGTGVIAAPSSPSTAITGLGSGTNILVHTITNGVCSPQSDTVHIIRDLPPSPVHAGSDQTVCAGAATLAAIQPTIGTGLWSAASATFADPSAHFSAVNGLTTGVNPIIWTVTNGVCPPAQDTVSIFRDAEPSEPDAGADQHVCSGSFTLNAADPATGFGKWYVLIGNPDVIAPSSATSSVNNLSPGQNIFEWRVSNGSCPYRSDTVIITRDEPPAAALAGNDTLVCGASVVVTGNQPSVGIEKWNLLSGSSTLASSGPHGTLTALGEGKNALVYSISSGVCPSTADTTVVTFFFPPGPAQAGSDTLTCSGNITLSAVTPTAGTGQWEIMSGSGVLTDPSLPSAALKGLRAGETTLKWTVRNGVCAAVSDQLSVVRDTLTATAFAGADLETESLSARFNAFPSQWPGNWQLVSGSGNIETPSDPNSAVTGLAPGKNYFRWTVSQGDCGSVSDDVLIFVMEFMIPNAISPNGDGRNDVFYITGLENYRPARLQLFNRWGSVVYEDSDYQNNWDGRNMRNERLSDDTYYYVINIPGKGDYSGFVTVKRN